MKIFVRILGIWHLVIKRPSLQVHHLFIYTTLKKQRAFVHLGENLQHLIFVVLFFLSFLSFKLSQFISNKGSRFLRVYSRASQGLPDNRSKFRLPQLSGYLLPFLPFFLSLLFLQLFSTQFYQSLKLLGFWNILKIFFIFSLLILRKTNLFRSRRFACFVSSFRFSRPIFKRKRFRMYRLLYIFGVF